MAFVVESVELKVPVSSAYNQRTQFEARGMANGAWRGDVEAPLQR